MNPLIPIIAQSLLDARLSQIAGLLTRPEVIFAGTAFILIFLGLGFSRKLGWIGTAAVVFFSGLAPFVTLAGDYSPPPFGLAPLVEYGRIAMLFALLLLLPGYAARSAEEPARVSVPLVAYAALTFYVIYCVRYLVTPQILQAGSRLATYGVVFYAIAVLMPRLCVDAGRTRRWIEAGVVAVFLFSFISVAGEIVSPGSFAWNNRLYGLGSNPNHTGMLLALSTPAFLCLLSWPGASNRNRSVLLVGWCFIMAAVAWTGSRGAAVTIVIGVLGFYRLRLGRLIFIAAPAAIILMFILGWIGLTEEAATRFSNLSDTRTAGWKAFLDAWAQHPVFGDSSLNMAITENSYLTLLANAGIFGLFGVVFLLLASVQFFLKLQLLEDRSPHVQVASNAAIGGITAVLAAGFIEGLLFSNLSTNVFWLYLYIGLGALAIGIPKSEEIPPGIR